MALTRDQKKAQVAELKDHMSKASSVIFTNYIGLKVSEVSELRASLRQADAKMAVGKKTLMKIAAKEAGLPEPKDDILDGPVACIFSFADPLTGAQVTFKFGKTHPQVKLIGGIFDGRLLSTREAISLAKMPDRLTLLATFAMMVRSPLTSFASICQSPLSGFARGLKQLSEKGGVLHS